MKHKIISTIGPKSLDKMKELYAAGSHFFRDNLSHQSAAWHLETVEKMQKECPDVQIILDTKGPEIRVKSTSKTSIKKGETLIIGKDIFFTVDDIFQYLESGMKVILDSGNIICFVEKIENELVFLNVEQGGDLFEREHVNIPSAHIPLNIFNVTDKEAIQACSNKHIYAVALSFVRNKEDIKEARVFLDSLNMQETRIIAKIENSLAIAALHEITQFSDEILVARGDLGMEMDWYKLGILEQEIIAVAKEYKKPCIVATEVLKSMLTQTHPSRAEIIDMTVAIQNGASIMLADETAVGDYPVKCVEVVKQMMEYVG